MSPWPGDICFSMWEDCYGSGAMSFPTNGWVLEIGCSEADWITPLMEERPDLSVIGIDWRIDRRATACAQVIGNVLTFPFAQGHFDAVVGVSSIEHIGLGHYDADPLDVDGDTHAVERAVGWLKPGGWFYADVPYDPAGYRVEGTSHRLYDDAAVQHRLLPAGLTLERVWHFPHHQFAGMAYVAILARKD